MIQMDLQFQFVQLLKETSNLLCISRTHLKKNQRIKQSFPSKLYSSNPFRSTTVQSPWLVAPDKTQSLLPSPSPRNQGLEAVQPVQLRREPRHAPPTARRLRRLRFAALPRTFGGALVARGAPWGRTSGGGGGEEAGPDGLAQELRAQGVEGAEHGIHLGLSKS